MRWTRDSRVALTVYFVIVFPGVLLHELSHWLMAVLLRVRVHRFSIGPVLRSRGQRVSLGSVQISKVDPVRATLIGLAPLLSGAAVILLIGNQVLGVNELVTALSGQGAAGVLAGLGQIVRVADFWLWLYLIFAVANAMLPSQSDLAPTRPVLIFLGIVVLLVVVVAGVPGIPQGVVNVGAGGGGYLATAFGITLAVDLVFMIVITLLTLLSRRLRP